VLQVLPDRWRFIFDEAGAGNDRGFQNIDFDDSKWALVSTRDITLDTQGFDKQTVLWYRTHFTVPAKHEKLTLFFGEVDGASEVYVNGKRLDLSSPDAPKAATKPATIANSRTTVARSRTPFHANITEAVRAGDNVVALRVDHTKMTDLSLGGILRPVVLIEQPR
jgi:beta-galactosidase/beta-glucuronidase